MRTNQEKAVLILVIFFLIQYVLGLNYDLYLFLDVFFYKKKIDKVIAENEYRKTNFHRWFKKMTYLIEKMEKNIDKIETLYHKIIKKSRKNG